MFAGTGVAMYSGDGGLALDASFNNPKGITVAPNGDVYVSDTDNQRIRRIGKRFHVFTHA